jgi:non-specific serine/threonine protein kinase/serine/threonine-protein kinase
MTRSENRSEREIFAAVLELERQARDAFLLEIGADDADLERRVRALVVAHEGSGLTPTDAPEPASQPPEPKTVGPYRLLERLGEGGMGVVYVAEQKEPVHRRVAIKLVKSGLNTRELVGRFHSERQALALMSHPNIARILDAGSTEDGRPYFVMEYVKGVPLLEYCDRRQLSVDERLGLFINVCLAVQHAHQKGVIHRDLKPTNILVEEVDGQPVPKVIDFGVAKALHQPLSDITVHTRLGGFIGTPEYVSPEQAGTTAQDVDTRADIYSLGAVLYELLTGLRPFDFREVSFAEIQRTLAEREPRPPSGRTREGGESAFARARLRRTDTEALYRKLRGDLDWITMKALEKDRARRYSAASELAADLERHRAHEAVLARPPSSTYRIGRFVRRHSLLLTASALALLALVVGTIGTSIGLVQARREAERARVSASIAEEVNAFLNDDLLAAVAPDEQGIGVSMREVLDTAAKRIEGRFPDQPLVEASLRRTIGRTYRWLGEHPSAEHHLLHALEIFEQNLGGEHSETRDTRLRLARLYRAEGRLGEAERALDEVLGGDVSTPDIADPLQLEVLEELAIVHHQGGRYEEAEALYFTAIAAREAITGRDHPDATRVLGNLAIVYRYMERWEEAEQLLREALEVDRRHNGPEHPTTLNTISKFAALYLAWNRNDEAEKYLKAGLDPMREVMGERHPQTLMMANNLGWLYLRQQRYGEAEELLLENFEAKRGVLGDLHPSTVEGLQNLVILYEEMGADQRHAEYLALFAETLDRVCDGPTARTEDRLDYANLLLSAASPGLRNPDKALSLALQAVEETGRADAEALAVLARAYDRTGDRDRAAATAEDALALTPEGSESRSRLEGLLASSEHQRR